MHVLNKHYHYCYRNVVSRSDDHIPDDNSTLNCNK